MREDTHVKTVGQATGQDPHLVCKRHEVVVRHMASLLTVVIQVVVVVLVLVVLRVLRPVSLAWSDPSGLPASCRSHQSCGQTLLYWLDREDRLERLARFNRLARL